MVDVLAWSDAHNGLITAFASSVIAIFTIVLAWVSRTQARLTREALITTERAFVFLDDFSPRWVFQPGTTMTRGSGPPQVSPPRFTEFVIGLRWMNSGTTATRNMRVFVNWTEMSGPLPGNFDYKYGDNPRKMFLAPQGSEWSDPIELPPSVATAALNGTTNVYIWGKVEYEDIFDGTTNHFTSWCYQMRVSLNNVHQPNVEFSMVGDYNRSDEDRV